jgi:hypothetical protein
MTLTKEQINRMSIVERIKRKGQFVAGITYDPLVHQWRSGVNLSVEKLAGQITSLETVEEIGLRIVFDPMVGQAQAQTNLIGMFLEIPATKREGRIDKLDLTSSGEDLHELEVLELAKHQFNPIEYVQQKNEFGFAVADESIAKSGHDLLKVDVQQGATQLATWRIKKMVEVAETADAVEGHSWRSASGGLSLNNPGLDLDAAISEIDSKYQVDSFAAGPSVHLAYNTNSYIHSGIGETLPGVREYSSSAFTSGVALLASRTAPSLCFIRGPVETELYRLELAGGWGYIARDWFTVKLTVPESIRKLTGLVTEEE